MPPVKERQDRALLLDEEDPLARFRDRFAVPAAKSGEPVTYLCGNSLGLMPKDTRRILEEELTAWETLAVEGHFEGARPWYSYDEPLKAPLARLLGAKESEVVVMNGLTVNLHLLMASFYRPTQERYRIVIEHSAFPSDRYAVQSQARFHGKDPHDAVVVLEPRAGEELLRTEDIERFFQEEGSSVALLLLGGVNFYTGQAYEHERITKAAKKAGVVVGLDLAHAAGNLVLSLHDWDVDFAAWCSYKYLSSGPGATAGAFVHERHDDEGLVRFSGWWGTDPATRFQMPFDFEPQRGAAGWQLSNAPVFSMAPLYASLALFDEATMPALRQKSEKLTAYALSLLDGLSSDVRARFTVLTPRDPAARGCQLSLKVHGDAEALNKRLEHKGVICDLRRPDVIRVAPVPLYNTFEDVLRFVTTFESCLLDEQATT